MARPMPRAPPVTMAVRWWRSIWFIRIGVHEEVIPLGFRVNISVCRTSLRGAPKREFHGWVKQLADGFHDGGMQATPLAPAECHGIIQM